ncbi:MAG: hypothetical protein ABI823_14895 [Bryobacteraceae bacterium]
MRKYLLVLASTALAIAQTGTSASSTTTYTSDLNGNRIPSITLSTNGNSQTERVQTINGRSVPLEQVVDKVVREDSSGKVIERTIRRFDQNGQPGPVEKVTIAETKRPDGSLLTETTVRRGDISGNMMVAERSRVETRIAGNSTTSETVVERPSVGGSLEVANKEVSVTTKESPDKSQQTSTLYRRDANGNFMESRRDVTETVKAGSIVTENTTTYEPTDSGRLTLAKQEARTTTQNPDGSERSEVNVFDSVAGRADSPGATPSLREQLLIDRKPTANGVVETVRVRRVNPSDPRRLGDARAVSETVCSGKCK